MSNKVKKSIEMTDVKISFISLVDKPANKRTFLVTKGDEKLIECRILDTDEDRHVLTSVVYEPLVKDAHDNFMTAAQIEKTAHWFLKHGNQVDFMHNFVATEGCAVVESYIAPDDMEIGGKKVTKGTWVAAIEVNDEIWDMVQKGDITGFSMGGIGTYADADVDIDEVEKSERKGLLGRLAKMLGIEPVEKGEFNDRFDYRVLETKFNTSFDVLRSILRPWDGTCAEGFATDEAQITEALREFEAAVRDVLASGKVMKCIGEPHLVTKSGRKISDKNAKKLSNIQTLIQELLDDANFEEKEIEKVMDKLTEALIDERVEKKLAEMGITKNAEPAGDPAPAGQTEPTEPAGGGDGGDGGTGGNDGEPAGDPQGDGGESIDDKVAKAIEKALPGAIEKAMEPYATVAGLPTNLNGQQQVAESESDCALHGLIL